MDIQPRIGKNTVYASDYLKLDSDVYGGGGTDETEIVQAILDKALEWGSVTLVMDGAALVSRLYLHSNTTIQCLNKSCGFFQKAGTCNAMVQNSTFSITDITTENINLLGGTYNFNGPNQGRYDVDPGSLPNYGYWVGEPNFRLEGALYSQAHFCHGMKFFGVRNVVLRDLCLADQAVYALSFTCWEHVVVENVYVNLVHNEYAHNQDGMHFYGPGHDLCIRNVGGNSGDDFLAIAPDENDCVSSITDVTIDGVYLDNADQGIRMLCRGTGKLDRVFVRNVHGTYKSFGFYINPWFGAHMGESEGNFGSMTFENIHLEQTWHKYSAYNEPVLFSVGGRIESLTLRNIASVNANDTRPLIEIGDFKAHPDDPHSFVDIACLTVDGMQIINRQGTQEHTDYITVDGKVDNLIVRDVTVDRAGNETDDHLVLLKAGAQVGKLVLSRVLASGIGEVLATEEGGSAEKIFQSDIY